MPNPKLHLLPLLLLGCAGPTEPRAPTSQPPSPGETAPSQEAPGQRAPCPTARERFLPVSPEESYGVPLVFVTPGGFDLFQLRVVDGKFSSWYSALDGAGKPLSDPVKLIDGNIWRNPAQGELPRYAAVLTRFEGTGYQAEVQLADVGPDGARVAATAAIPNDGFGIGTVSLAWSPGERAWGVVWEQSVQIPGAPRGHVYNRLFFRLLGADGAWRSEAVALTSAAPESGAFISDWGQPLIWTGERFAIAWQEAGGQPRLVLGEITPGGALSRTTVASGARISRAKVVWDGRRYGIAWAHWIDDHFEERFAFVTGGEVSEPIALGREGVDSNNAVAVYNGREFVVAFDESHAPRERPASPQGVGPSPGPPMPPPSPPAPPPGRVLRLARIDPASPAPRFQALETADPAHQNWPMSLVWNGCEHLVGLQTGLRSEHTALWFFP